MTAAPEVMNNNNYPQYEPVSTAEAKRINVLLPVELLDEVDRVSRTIPGYTKTLFWQEALRAQLVEWIESEVEIKIGGSSLIKRAGERFPKRLSDSIGRPPDSTLRDRGETGEVQLRLPPELAEDYKDAVFWQSADLINLSYAIEDGVRNALERFK